MFTPPPPTVKLLTLFLPFLPRTSPSTPVWPRTSPGRRREACRVLTRLMPSSASGPAHSIKRCKLFYSRQGFQNSFLLQILITKEDNFILVVTKKVKEEKYDHEDCKYCQQMKGEIQNPRT